MTTQDEARIRDLAARAKAAEDRALAEPSYENAMAWMKAVVAHMRALLGMEES